MPTTFANTINGNPIYASRAESDKDGNRIDTTYAKLSDIPPGVTVDQTYDASSTNAQSGTAVADALSGINQVPASTSSDEDKVLTVDSNGDPVWAASQGAPQVQANWTESDTTDPAYIQHKPTEKSLVAGTNITISSDSSTITISSVAVDQTYNSASTNPQSGTAVAGAIASVNQVPASTASDEDKVLTVNSSGTPVWATPQGGGGSQVQSDWTESDTTDPSYIQNKPTEKSLVAGTNVAITSDSSSVTISATDTTYTAGTGIDITNNAISVETPVDETVLYDCSDNYVYGTNSVTLSESYKNFEVIKILNSKGNVQFYYPANNQNVALFTLTSMSNGYLWLIPWTFTSNTVYAGATGKLWTVGATTAIDVPNNAPSSRWIQPIKIVGINRIAGGE